jgi:hypothetical protein
MIFYPDGWELAVDNPGFGELIVIADQELSPRLINGQWRQELYGAAIGAFLDQVTNRALGLDDGEHSGTPLPRFLSPELARAVLPALQKAVLLATAGTDRFEKTFPDPDEAPQKPICVRCNIGSPYTSEVATSEWCEQYGHRPFGASASRWEHAQEMYQLALDRWKRAEARRREEEALASGLTREAIDLDAARRARRGNATA